MKMLILFTLATVINVTLNTVKLLCTTKGGKLISAVINAICYGFYPLIVLLTANGTVDIVANMIITAIVNFVCVYIIKAIEKKMQKDKLWLVKMTIPKAHSQTVMKMLQNSRVPFSCINIEKYMIFDTYCSTQEQTSEIAKICKIGHGKMFAIENKL